MIYRNRDIEVTSESKAATEELAEMVSTVFLHNWLEDTDNNEAIRVEMIIEGEEVIFKIRQVKLQ